MTKEAYEDIAKFATQVASTCDELNNALTGIDFDHFKTINGFLWSSCWRRSSQVRCPAARIHTTKAAFRFACVLPHSTISLLLELKLRLEDEIAVSEADAALRRTFSSRHRLAHLSRGPNN
jgi:hypothetical protein